MATTVEDLGVICHYCTILCDSLSMFQAFLNIMIFFFSNWILTFSKSGIHWRQRVIPHVMNGDVCIGLAGSQGANTIQMQTSIFPLARGHMVPLAGIRAPWVSMGVVCVEQGKVLVLHVGPCAVWDKFVCSHGLMFVLKGIFVSRPSESR